MCIDSNATADQLRSEEWNATKPVIFKYSTILRTEPEGGRGRCYRPPTVNQVESEALCVQRQPPPACFVNRPRGIPIYFLRS